MRFFTSDTHFGHKNIIRYCDRPFDDVPHMNEMLIKNWNAVVSPEDEVFHLGDVALGPWVEWEGILSRLNGTIHLIIGNHDRIFKGESEKNQNKFGEFYGRMFTGIISDHATAIPFRTKNGGVLVNMSHFPYDGDSHGEDRYEDFRLPDNGRPLIHGHTHLKEIESRSKNGTPQFHVGVDAHGYAPVPEERIIEWLESL